MSARPLCIIDGSNLARRAFHAGGSLGVSHAARKVRALYAEVYGDDVEVAAAWDGPPPTWRHRLWPAYKAHRVRDPEALRAVRLEYKGTLAEGIPGVLAYDGEADDAAAALAKRATAAGREVVLVSSDKDWGQLLGPGVTWLSPTNGGALDQRTAEWFVDRYGVGPEEWPDYVGLAGDPTDGIPGIRGIGPKRAAQLLFDYGSLDGVLEHYVGFDEEQAKVARICRELATLKTDAAIDWRLTNGA